ncbi:unnamed protein product, partial [Brachionus calyciflorus]
MFFQSIYCLLVFPNILVYGYYVTEAFFSKQNQEKIYVDLEINHVIKDNDLFPNTFKIRHYNEKNGWGTASLVNDGSNQLKIIGRIFIENTTSHFVILPFHHSSKNKHSRSNSISH